MQRFYALFLLCSISNDQRQKYFYLNDKSIEKSCLSVFFRDKYHAHQSYKHSIVDQMLGLELNTIDDSDNTINDIFESNKGNSSLTISTETLCLASTTQIVSLLKKYTIKSLKILSDNLKTDDSPKLTQKEKLIAISSQLKQNNQGENGTQVLKANFTEFDTTEMWLCLKDIDKFNLNFGAFRDGFFSPEYGISQFEYSHITFSKPPCAVNASQ